MKEKIFRMIIFLLVFIPVLSPSISADSKAELKVDISDSLESKNPIIRYFHGLQIENVGEEAAVGVAVDFWATGGMFSKLRDILKMRDYWAYGCGKIEAGEKTYCPIHLSVLYLGNIELTAMVWADNADPATETVEAFVSVAFIWIK